MGQLRSEKCELREAQEVFSKALEMAKAQGDLRATMEALAGRLRLAGEAMDSKTIEELGSDLDFLMKKFPLQVPPMAWYCKGALARHSGEAMQAQRFFHKYLRAVRKDRSGGSLEGELRSPTAYEEAAARGWIMMAVILWQRGRLNRSEWLAHALLKRFGKRGFRGLDGMIYLTLGNLEEKKRNFDEALRYFHQAHAAFLGEHSWYYHLYVLYGYARVARKQRNFEQAEWYLDLIDKAAAGSEFGLLRCDLQTERDRIRADSVDLVIDGRQGFVQTRDGGQISLRKQYVLLHILEALAYAHRRVGDDHERGLSKAEIIQAVWNENYRPEAHDNKLYYNINRLRKLIEQDVHHPKYLLNWKEGYRLAPDLKVHFVATGAISAAFMAKEKPETGAHMASQATAQEVTPGLRVRVGVGEKIRAETVQEK